VRGSAAGARPVSATGGTRRSVLSAEGCGVLWRAAGALAGCGVVWCRGASDGCGEGSGVFFSSMSHGRGLGRGDWGSTAR
jgi:hypothetical protein